MRKLFLILISGIFCLNLLTLSTLNSFAIESNEEDDFYVAAKAFEDGFYDLSLGTFEHFIKRYPNSSHLAQVQFYIGRCLFYKGNYLNALNQLQALLTDPRATSFKDALLYWIGEVHFKGADFNKAAGYYRQIINDYPASAIAPSAYYSLGKCQFELEKFDEAISTFSQLIDKFPKHKLSPDAAFEVSESLFRDKRYSRSQESFEKFINDFPQSERNPQAIYFLAEIAYYNFDYNQALNLYRKALSQLERKPQQKTDEQLKNLVIAGMGWTYLKQGKNEEAYRIFSTAKETDAVLLGIAAIKFMNNDLDSSITAYNRLVTNFPQSSFLIEALLGKAETLYKLADFDEAVKLYKDIILRFSKNSKFEEFENKVYYGLAWAYLKSGQFQEAIKEFEKIAKTSSDEIIKISALCQMADTLQETGQLDRAIETYDRALKDYPTSLYSDYAQFQLGVSLYKLERLEPATLAFQAVIDNFPKTKLKGRAKYYLALIYFQQSNFKAASERLSEFINEHHDTVLRNDALYLLASSSYNLGQFKQALIIFERIFKENFKLDEKLSQAAEYEVANCLYQLGKEKDALERFKVFLRKHPESKICADILYWIGEYYMTKRNFETSRRYFRFLINDYPDHELTEAAEYNIALTYVQSDRIRAALKAFSDCLKFKNIELSLNAAMSMVDIYSASSEFKDALNICEQLLSDKRFNKYKALILIKKADTLRAMHNYNQALAVYNQALDESGEKKDLQLLFKIAEVEEENAQLDLALKDFLKIIYLPATDPDLSKHAMLRAARICETQNKWDEAKKIYKKLKDTNVEEARYAAERLTWIEKNIRKK
jgi:TolA-binding protein